MELPSERTLRYWGRKAGGFLGPQGLRMYKGKRGTNSPRNNSNAKPKHDMALLVANARARGWVNGLPIKKGGR